MLRLKLWNRKIGGHDLGMEILGIMYIARGLNRESMARVMKMISRNSGSVTRDLIGRPKVRWILSKL